MQEAVQTCFDNRKPPGPIRALSRGVSPCGASGATLLDIASLYFGPPGSPAKVSLVVKASVQCFCHLFGGVLSDSPF